MEIPSGNTAATPATFRLGSKEARAVTDEQFDREKRYQASMNMFRTMLKNGLITEEQYAIIDTKMLEKYRPLLGTLFSEVNYVYKRLTTGFLPVVRRFLMLITCLTLFLLLPECILKGESHHQQLV